MDSGESVAPAKRGKRPWHRRAGGIGCGILQTAFFCFCARRSEERPPAAAAVGPAGDYGHTERDGQAGIISVPPQKISSRSSIEVHCENSNTRCPALKSSGKSSRSRCIFAEPVSTHWSASTYCPSLWLYSWHSWCKSKSEYLKPREGKGVRGGKGKQSTRGAATSKTLLVRQRPRQRQIRRLLPVLHSDGHRRPTMAAQREPVVRIRRQAGYDKGKRKKRHARYELFPYLIKRSSVAKPTALVHVTRDRLKRCVAEIRAGARQQRMVGHLAQLREDMLQLLSPPRTRELLPLLFLLRVLTDDGFIRRLLRCKQG